MLYILVMSIKIKGGNKFQGQGENLLYFFFFFYRVFQSQVLQNFFRVFVFISIISWDYARFLQKIS